MESKYQFKSASLMKFFKVSKMGTGKVQKLKLAEEGSLSVGFSVSKSLAKTESLSILSQAPITCEA